MAALLPDFRGRRRFVGQRIGGIVELVGEEGARQFARQARRIILVVLGMALAHVRARGVHFGAQGFQVQHFFRRHLVGHDENHAVALDAADQRQADAGIAGRRLDDGAARLQAAVRFGRLDDGQSDAVLDGTAWILRFQFQEQLAQARIEPGHFDQRGIADQLV
ncbi:hypothetical protein D3C72_1788340 [compost metagenome]